MEFLIVALVCYFLPTIIAVCRGHASGMAIFAVNLLLGWSVIGWLFSFIWSLANKGQGSVTIVNSNSNNNNGGSR